jgi:glutamate formiminotransferase/formiminotetrahydrofolate cyclodeaminase
LKKNVDPSATALHGSLRLDEFIASVAGISPLLPAGGSVAALAASLAAALGEMMSGVTEGREKFAAVDLQVREIHAKLSRLRGGLRNLVQEDAEAFGSVMAAIKLPKDTEELKIARAEAVEKALRAATETPLRIARASGEIMELLQVLVQVGNPNARCDAAVGVQMAFASLKGAQYNVLANIKRLKDKEFAGNCRTEVMELVQRGWIILQQVDMALT